MTRSSLILKEEIWLAKKPKSLLTVCDEFYDIKRGRKLQQLSKQTS